MAAVAVVGIIVTMGRRCLVDNGLDEATEGRRRHLQQLGGAIIIIACWVLGISGYVCRSTTRLKS